ncbi:hypothetical protein X772_34750 [Mesorhizobium sp. LSJC280B00]|nr:hypothetical protein X772_34750 [Mesorhizobium sp. LSJC280B00]
MFLLFSSIAFGEPPLSTEFEGSVVAQPVQAQIMELKGILTVLA